MNQKQATDLENPLIAKDQWLIEPKLRFLNHGSFGACPIEILEHQSHLRAQMESSLVRYNLCELPKAIEQAKQSLTSILGCAPQDLCFVSNASEGVMTILNSIDWKAGDEVIISQDSYPACRHMLTHLSLKHDLVIKIAQTPFGAVANESLQEWNTRVLQAFADLCTSNTRLLLIDHITSPTALVYPVKDLITLAKKWNALSLVDGAHAPGQLALDLTSLQADFYVGNTHKWLLTPKSCAVLYVNPKWQNKIFPLVLSHGYLAEPESRFQALFSWTGTRDYTPMITIPKTIAWLNKHGGLDHIRQRNNKLCAQARQLLIQALWYDEASKNTPALPPIQSIAHMAAIPLPQDLANFPLHKLNHPSPSSSASASRIHPLQQALWTLDYEVPIIETAHGTLLRISAQAYNSLDEYQALAHTLIELRNTL